VPEEPIIQPHRRPDDPTVPDAVALIPAPFAYHRAARHLKGLAEGVRDRRVDFFHLCQPSEAPVPWTVAGPALGAPAAVLALEKLIVLGARRILVLGPCGSLAAEAPIGTVVVPTEAVSEEGTSRLYGAEADRPLTVAGPAVQGLEATLAEAGIPHQRGRVWTTDAPYRETRRKVQEFQAQGIVGVEMELAACLAAGAFRGVTVAGLFVVSDELFALQWVKGFDNPSFVDAFRQVVEVLPALLGNLAA
jgi:uridine phosphorylase